MKNIKLLFFLYFYLILNTIISENPSMSILRNLGFLRYIIFIAAIQYFLNSSNKQKYIKLLANYWTIILSVVCIDVYFEFFILCITTNMDAIKILNLSTSFYIIVPSNRIESSGWNYYDKIFPI